MGFIIEKTIRFQRSRGGPTFFRGGGSNFFQGGGGGQMLISIETYITCDFVEGSVPLPPPPPPTPPPVWIRTRFVSVSVSVCRRKIACA